MTAPVPKPVTEPEPEPEPVTDPDPDPDPLATSAVAAGLGRVASATPPTTNPTSINNNSPILIARPLPLRGGAREPMLPSRRGGGAGRAGMDTVGVVPLGGIASGGAVAARAGSVTTDRAASPIRAPQAPQNLAPSVLAAPQAGQYMSRASVARNHGSVHDRRRRFAPSSVQAACYADWTP
jgi:hypothetical protein